MSDMKNKIISAAGKYGGLAATGLFTVLEFLAPTAYAATSITSITNTGQIADLICSIAGYMFDILIAVSSVMVLVAAYLYLTAGGDAEKTGKAHKTITYAALGIVVALLAKNFPLIVGSVFGVSGINGCK